MTLFYLELGCNLNYYSEKNTSGQLSNLVCHSLFITEVNTSKKERKKRNSCQLSSTPYVKMCHELFCIVLSWFDSIFSGKIEIPLGWDAVKDERKVIFLLFPSAVRYQNSNNAYFFCCVFIVIFFVLFVLEFGLFFVD